MDDILKTLAENFTFKKNHSLKEICDELNTSGNVGEIGSDEESGNKCDSLSCESSNNCYVKTLCYILQNLETMFNVNMGEYKILKTEKNKRCTYFKYWFYNHVITKGFEYSKVLEILTLFERSHGKFKLSIYEHADSCEININTLEDVKKIKVLLDYLENYNEEQRKSDINDVICNSDYKNSLDEMIDLYNNSDEQESDKPELCIDTIESKLAYGYKNLPKLQCSEESGRSPLSDSSPQTRGSESGIVADPPSLSAYNGENPQIVLPLPSENGNVGTGTIIASTFAGIFVSFASLYKLTPFGPLLFNSVLKNMNIHNSIDGPNNELLENISKSDNVDFPNMSNYIAYHPT
ncbi:PIR protein [Plasmodium ovale]|uniref:PIR protein n=1 Tax=Plasmodium ovale TaxID=36330 RepID=A0A1D3JFF4_PLAOA|nr:PIR protein [Plasmodium ovale]